MTKVCNMQSRSLGLNGIYRDGTCCNHYWNTCWVSWAENRAVVSGLPQLNRLLFSTCLKLICCQFCSAPRTLGINKVCELISQPSLKFFPCSLGPGFHVGVFHMYKSCQLSGSCCDLWGPVPGSCDIAFWLQVQDWGKWKEISIWSDSSLQ